jgi:hypothetical protein
MRTNNATLADPRRPAAPPRGSVGPRPWCTSARRRFAGVRALLLLALAAAALPTASRAAPLLQLSEDVMVVVEEPSDGQTVAGDVVVRGWAIDRRAAGGSGVRTTPGGVQVWLDRSAGSATGQLLGDAVYGGDRPDVAQQRGDAFRRSGFALPWNACLVPPGPHTLQVFAESDPSAPQFGFAQVSVQVGTCPGATRSSEVVGSQPIRTNPLWQAIAQRTAELRGLAPRQELYRAPLTRESYDRRYQADYARYFQSQDVDTSRLLLVAFGLLEPGFNLAATLQSFHNTLPLGIYDPDNAVLFVSSDPPESPMARVTMAHELTHALQDQHYDLKKLLPSSQATPDEQRAFPPDAQAAVRALVEGDALIVQNMYQATTIQNPADLERLAAEQAQASADADVSSLPYAVYQGTYFPYLYGPQFIYGVLGTAPLTTYGQYGPAMDPLFRRLPTSTSQILHPERYRDGVQPVPVELRSLIPILGDDWEALGDGTLGEFDHRLILDNFLRGVDPDRGTVASSGWTGDQSGVYRRRDATGAPLGDIAVVLKTRWATPADADAWAQAYADSVGLRFADPQRYAGRTDQLMRTDLGPGRIVWEMPGERAIALQRTGQFSAIAIAPDTDLARQLAEYAMAGQQ